MKSTAASVPGKVGDYAYRSRSPTVRRLTSMMRGPGGSSAAGDSGGSEMPRWRRCRATFVCVSLLIIKEFCDIVRTVDQNWLDDPDYYGGFTLTGALEKSRFRNSPWKVSDYLIATHSGASKYRSLYRNDPAGVPNMKARSRRKNCMRAILLPNKVCAPEARPTGTGARRLVSNESSGRLEP